MIIKEQTLQFKIVNIGDQTWSGENISIPLEGAACYENNPENCKLFGPLYTHAQATEVAENFPGWRLPAKSDVETLMAFLGGKIIAGKALKVGGSSGFNALFAGYRDALNGKYYRIHEQTGFWTSTAMGEEKAWKFYLTTEQDILNFYPVSKNYGDSIRLIKIK